MVLMLCGETSNTSATTAFSTVIGGTRTRTSQDMMSSTNVHTPTRLSLDGSLDEADLSLTELLPLPPHPPRRISSSLLASSEIVMSLFGEFVGPCWGDFSCTHMCIRGRLYATSQAILYYTNLLGFERRICLLLRDVVELELYRTTSIRIHTSDLETYIFKSFNDREQVLHLLSGLQILATKTKSTNNSLSTKADVGSHRTRSSGSSDIFLSQQQQQRSPPIPSPIPLNQYSPRTMSPDFVNTTSTAPTTRTSSPVSSSAGIPSLLPTPPSSPNCTNANRRRAASDSIVRLLPSDTTNNKSNNSLVPICRLEHIPSNEDDLFATSGGRLSPTQQQLQEPQAPPAQQYAAAWDKIQQGKQSLGEVGLENLILPCSLEDYYKKFLEDDAQYSLDYYQKEYVKDKNVELMGWDISPEGDFCRTITFTHPIKNSTGIGPSSAQASRQQRLRKFPGLGMALENKTVIEGIPGADCFHIQDLWLLQVMDNNNSNSQQSQQVQLSVYYDVKFKKRSLFRNIITKSVKKETKEWIAGYVDMVQSVLLRQEDEVAAVCTVKPTGRTVMGGSNPLEDTVAQCMAKLDHANQVITYLLSLMILALLFFSYQVMSMNHCMMNMQADLHAMAVIQRGEL